MSIKEELLQRKPALYLFKCRYCGEGFIEAHGDGNVHMWDHGIIKCAENITANKIPHTTVHVHKDNSLGVADLIGAREITLDEIEVWML